MIPLGLVLGLFITACGGPSSPPETVEDVPVTDTADGAEVMRIGDRLFSIPSPVQTALAIRKAGLAYRKDLTVPLERGDAMVGQTAQAIALGMMGADLAYVTVHQDGQRAMATMQAIEKLGNALEMGNAFDRTLIDSFKKNLGNEDSLLRFSGAAFRAADQYLKNNERDDVSTLVLTGGWIESLHLTLSDPEARKDQALLDRIGDQRATLDGLVALMEGHGGQDASAVLDGLRTLRGHFSGIERQYSFEEPVTDAAARTTYINSRSTVTIPAEKLEAIAGQVSALRAKILA